MKYYVVLYARNSSNPAMPSVETQLAVCHELANRKGYAVVGEYIDWEDCSAELNRIIMHRNKPYIHGVVIYTQAVISPKPFSFFQEYFRFWKNGLSLHTTLENLDEFETRMAMQTLLAFRDYWWEEHSRKVKEGLRRAKERKAALAAENSRAA